MGDGRQWAGGRHSLHRPKLTYKTHICLQPMQPSFLSISFLKNPLPETTQTDLSRFSPTDRCDTTFLQPNNHPHIHEVLAISPFYSSQKIEAQRSVPSPRSQQSKAPVSELRPHAIFTAVLRDLYGWEPQHMF